MHSEKTDTCNADPCVLARAPQVEAGWDKLKGTAKETFQVVAKPVFHEVQKQMPAVTRRGCVAELWGSVEPKGEWGGVFLGVLRMFQVVSKRDEGVLGRD